MGTTYMVRIAGFPEDEAKRKELASSIEDELTRLNQIFSTYAPDSEISRLNGLDQTTPVPVSKDLMLVLQAARGLYESTHGVFDPTVAPLVSLWGFGPSQDRIEPPTREEIEKALELVGFDKIVLGPGDTITKTLPGVQVDLSANAKGYAVDKVYEYLVSQGFRDVLVEIGGELRVSGHNEEGKPWLVGIASIESSGEMLSLEAGGVATSGVSRNFFEYQGERYSHLIDPRTGYPLRSSLTSVTVLAPTCLDADGAATAVMVLGNTGGYQWISQQAEMQALLLCEDSSGEVSRQMTAGFLDYLIHSSS